ncbi:hypothetical protein DJ030_12710 [bacterium endosymbiont of Escarpia laminata]|nr:MAG: hypothetical protein DJ031_12265 [bacterium endosymbiont of Escarpia laminata]RLJ18240.1 MAG: hypothetical protein DJ030_12710 [bacterium endosymbiont of Escarpia laminata]
MDTKQQFRSIGEKFILSLEQEQQRKNPIPEIREQLHSAAETMEEHYLLLIGGMGNLLEQLSENDSVEISHELVADVGTVINELAVFAHLAMGTRNRAAMDPDSQVGGG